MAVQPKTKVGRNEKCPCGSGLKFCHCHGDPAKQMLCNRMANEHMAHLIRREQKRQGLVPYQFICEDCGHGFDEPEEGVIAVSVCPKCESANITENKNEKKAEEEKDNGEKI